MDDLQGHSSVQNLIFHYSSSVALSVCARQQLWDHIFFRDDRAPFKSHKSVDELSKCKISKSLEVGSCWWEFHQPKWELGCRFLTIIDKCMHAHTSLWLLMEWWSWCLEPKPFGREEFQPLRILSLKELPCSWDGFLTHSLTTSQYLSALYKTPHILWEIFEGVVHNNISWQVDTSLGTRMY